MSEWTVIRHPVTGRFVCAIDFQRDIMKVSDRGQEALIDLSAVRSAEHGRAQASDDNRIRVAPRGR